MLNRTYKSKTCSNTIQIVPHSSLIFLGLLYSVYGTKRPIRFYSCCNTFAVWVDRRAYPVHTSISNRSPLAITNQMNQDHQQSPIICNCPDRNYRQLLHQGELSAEMMEMVVTLPIAERHQLQEEIERLHRENLTLASLLRAHAQGHHQ